jgi:glycosyltransferase involved in cell wall biosynthesis
VDGDQSTGSLPDTVAGPAHAGRRPKRFSVVIPALNAEEHIGEQLGSLAQQSFTGDWEVVVVDNGSTDATVAVVEKWSERVRGLRVVDASSRPGRSPARNFGAEQAAGDFLLFLDADDRVVPGWLAAMADAAARADVLGGAVRLFHVDPDGDEVFEDEQTVRAVVPAFGFLPFVRSCNLGVRTELFRGEGGFDESYDQAEDVELCWRLQLAGHPLLYVPDAVVHYRVRRETRPQVRTAFRDGRGIPQLYRDFRGAGMPRSSSWSAVRDTVGTLSLHRPRRWFDADARRQLVSRLAFRAGNVAGSVHHRVFYL